jgi:hypothetical protein
MPTIRQNNSREPSRGQRHVDRGDTMRGRPRTTTGLLVALLLGATATYAPAQDPRAPAQRAPRAAAAERVTRLGTADALYRRLQTRDDLRRMANDRAAQRRLSSAMDAAGLTALTSELLAVLASPDAARVTDVRIDPGTRMEWMAFRQGTRGRLQRPAVWAGSQPFEAWRFSLEHGATRYTFLVPKACGNLSLLDHDALPPPPPAPTDDTSDRLRREQDERARLEREREAQQRAERERADAEQRAADEARRVQEAEQARGEAERRERERLEQERLAREAARERIDWFVAGSFGKERRVRDLDVVTADGVIVTESGQCAPLLGVKIGADIRLARAWRVAPAVGVAINTDEGDDSSLFAEVELNRHWERGFVGTGLGVWDVTHSDTLAATWLLHGGRDIHRQDNGNRLVFTVEARLFLDQLDDIANNYQFWGGLRYVIR